MDAAAVGGTRTITTARADAEARERVSLLFDCVAPFVFPLLPLDARALAACTRKAWRAAAADVALWVKLDFEHCAVDVTNATLAALCARAGPALRTLRLTERGCAFVTGNSIVAALRDGGCTGLQNLWAGDENPEHRIARVDDDGDDNNVRWFSAETVHRLAAAYPALQFACCAVRCSVEHAAVAAAMLPGPLAVFVESPLGRHPGDSFLDVTQLAESLRVNNTVMTLIIKGANGKQSIWDKGATQLAECLRVSTMLKRLDLCHMHITDEGMIQLAESLCVNTTLTSLNLNGNDIGDVGATQLAKCLRVNTALASLKLQCCFWDDQGARTKIAESLRSNATLASLDLSDNNFGAEDVTELTESMRVNATLTSLYLS